MYICLHKQFNNSFLYVLQYDKKEQNSIYNMTFCIQAVRIEFFFLLKVANIQCFILIAIEIFHNIIRKQPRTKEIRRCLIFLHPVENSMLTRAIFIRPDSELIRDSVCPCAKLFVDEENVGCAKIESWKNKNTDGFHTKTTQKG